MNNLSNLEEKISILEKESKNITQLDRKLHTRIMENKRKTTIEETRFILNVIEINAKKRTSINHLYIYAEQMQPARILNSIQAYSFKIITSQEIEQKIHNDRDTGLYSIWNPINRLTEYNEFKQRANLLIENLETGKLDNHLNTTSGELLYEILGRGKLLKRIGVDPAKNLTQIYLNKQIQHVKKIYEIFNSDPKKS
jgi:hypothetical protein